MTDSSTRRCEGGGQRRLGEFILLEELGRGGMGVVFRARQESLGRIVAVKTLPSFAGHDPDAVARFRREAESAGRISHRGIVPVYAVGEDQGTYYYAMELVDGPSLAAMLEELAGRNPSRLLGALADETALRERCPGFLAALYDRTATGARYAASCAAIAADLANALAFAHQAQIIHRDLKPSNVLLCKDGRAMIVDFGLARDQTAVGLTLSGDAVGTPSYMAPEQAYGAKDLDARVDIYGLGATLFEMLALRPPFEGAHAAEIMRQIMDSEPPNVRSLNSRVPADLATIVHKCLAKDRDARYPVMEAVEHDLRAFLAGRPIGAHTPSLWSRGVMLSGRHRRGIGVVAATTAVLSLAGVAVGLFTGTRARDEGVQLLATAGADLLERGSIELAQTSYGRADQLLRDPAALAAARAQHLAAAFTRFYADAAKHDWLARLLETVPADARDAAWSGWQRRLRGQGRCTLNGHLLDDETTVGVSRLANERFEPLPGGWPADGQLAVGSYLVHVDRIGLAPATVAFQVERDATSTIEVPQVSIGSVREGDVLIASAAQPDRTFALSRTELGGREFEELLRGMTAAQREEFAGVQVDHPERPVHGLSFRQARALAAAAQGHLPAADEFALAARGGASAAAMPYPWGATFGRDRVSADPISSSQTEPVDSLPAGASPFGVLHLAGNVAEMLAVGANGVSRVAGGDYLSQPDQVRTDAVRIVEGLDRPMPRCGVRVARFLAAPRAADAEAANACSARLQSLWQEGGAVLLSDWEFDDAGGAQTRLRIAGFLTRAKIPLSTPGFLHEGTPTVRVGDHEAPVVRQVSVDGETSEFEVSLAGLAARQLSRIDIATKVVPLSGLVGRADGYVLQIPLKATGSMPSCYRVTLPKGCRVDEVEPAPTWRFQQGERPVLMWEFGADARGMRAFSGVVRFRKDGFLTRDWPTKAEALAVVQELGDALAAGDATRLQRLLAPTFVLAPSGCDVRRLLDPARDAREHFERPRFVDVTAVGRVVTADLIVQWRVTDRAGERSVADWPLRVHWRRDRGRVEILQAAPAAGGDTGRLVDGAYVHDQLLVRIEPSQDFTMSRTLGRLASMQVELRPLDLGLPQWVMLLGTFDESDSAAAALWERLSDGVHVVGGDNRRLDARKDRWGKHPADLEDWQFAAGVQFTHERWLKVRIGRRWLLVRQVAKGHTDVEAKSNWNAAEGWFNRVLQRVQVD